MGKSAKAFKRPTLKEKKTTFRATSASKALSVREGGISKREAPSVRETVTAPLAKKKSGGAKVRLSGANTGKEVSKGSVRDYVELMYGKKKK